MTVSVQRDHTIDVTRALLVLAVVMLHVSHMLNSSSPTAHHIDYWLTPVRMPALLLVSGLLSGRAARSSRFPVPRLQQLGWVLLLWTPIMWLISSLLHMPFDPLWELVTPSSHLWYIWLLLLTGASLPIWSSGQQLMLVLSGTASLANHLGWLNSNNLAVNDLARLSWFFYLGVAVSVPVRQHLQRLQPAPALATIGFVLLCHVLVGNTTGLVHGVSAWLQSHGMALLVLYGGAVLARSPLRAGLQHLGTRTLPVYLAHMPLLLLLGSMLPASSSLMIVLLGTLAITVACLLLDRATTRMGAVWLWQSPVVYRKHPVRVSAQAER